MQGQHYVIVGDPIGSTGASFMNDTGDSAVTVFHLSPNVSDSHDIKVVMVYAASSAATTPTMNISMALTATDDTETFSWNYKNAEATSMTKPSVTFELKRKEWVIPHASFDAGDKLTIYWINTNPYDYYCHGISLEYTEAT